MSKLLNLVDAFELFGEVERYLPKIKTKSILANTDMDYIKTFVDNLEADPGLYVQLAALFMEVDPYDMKHHMHSRDIFSGFVLGMITNQIANLQVVLTRIL